MNSKEKADKIIKIADIVSELGWCIALPESADQTHLIIGEPDLVKIICAQIETENYELLEKKVIQ